MNAIRRLYVDGTFGQIHVRIASPIGAASRPPLYCLHQSPKSSLEFEDFMKHASSDRIVVSFDYPKYGMSDGPKTEAEVSIRVYAEAAFQVADTLGHDYIDLFGNHTGGKVAVEMALMRPQAIHAITMISAAIFTQEERKSFEDLFTPIPLDAEGTRHKVNWQRIIERHTDNVSLETLDRSFYMTMMAGEAYEWGHTAAFAYDTLFNEGLKKLDQRITIFNPTDDLTFCTQRASKFLKNGEVVEKPEWSHNLLAAFPEDIAKCVREKLDASPV